MQLNEFTNEYSSHIDTTKRFDNGIIRFKFTRMDKVMWLKRMVYEKLGLIVFTRSHTKPVVYFKPKEN